MGGAEGLVMNSAIDFNNSRILNFSLDSVIDALQGGIDADELGRNERVIFDALIGLNLVHSPEGSDSLKRVELVLHGAFEEESLTDEEGEILDKMRWACFLVTPTKAVQQAYAALGKQPGSVGEDADGQLVRVKRDGSLEILDSSTLE